MSVVNQINQPKRGKKHDVACKTLYWKPKFKNGFLSGPHKELLYTMETLIWPWKCIPYISVACNLLLL